MRILLIGNGGREHAMAWAISASPLCDYLIISPGNIAMQTIGEIVNIAIDDHDRFVQLAKDRDIDMVIIGPEAPLVAGLVDKLDEAGIMAFGPTAKAAQLEGSKQFARAFCDRHDIAQPQWKSCHSIAEAYDYAQRLSGYCVIKADGLAAGKGVIVCDDLEAAKQAIETLFAGKFGAADSVLVEQRITGAECSAFALLDGKQAVWLASAQDHKRAFDHDKGANTGGMGAVSPSPYETALFRQEVMENIITPIAEGMADEGYPYRGILYAGLMLTTDGAQVIEFNCRFGDPEAQAILPRMKSDFLVAAHTVCEGGLNSFDMRWSDEASVSVVMATKGYPDSYERGSVILGVDDLETNKDYLIFHSGTDRNQDGQLIANGGRVLSITALGKTQKIARETAYQAIAEIDWPEGFYRRDIGDK